MCSKIRFCKIDKMPFFSALLGLLHGIVVIIQKKIAPWRAAKEMKANQIAEWLFHLKLN